MARIAVLHILEATTGGTRRHLMDLVTHLDRDRFSPSVICSTLRDPAILDDIRCLREAGIPVCVIQMVRAISPIRDLLAFLRMRRHIKRHSYTLVHTHSSKAGFLGRLAARVCRVPVVVHTPHVFAFQMDVSRARRALYSCLERFAARLTDRIICVCQSEREEALARRLAPAAKLTVIENGIPPPTAGEEIASRAELLAGIGIEAEGLVVGTIGRYTAQKGQPYLIRAAKRVIARFPKTQFLIMGDGETHGELRRLTTALALDAQCRLRPVPADTRPCHAAFDIFVLPSLWEGSPYTLLDAMAAGRAIVATRVGGVPEMIEHGVSGLLVPARDPEALANGIISLLEDTEMRKRLGGAAREAACGRYALADMVRKVENLYDACVMSVQGNGHAGGSDETNV